MLHTCTLYYFFFQAEDGIRDDLVTGVQTCALPILTAASAGIIRLIWPPSRSLRAGPSDLYGTCTAVMPRSEERRVGKECRSRGSAYHEKKKKHVIDRIVNVVSGKRSEV